MTFPAAEATPADVGPEPVPVVVAADPGRMSGRHEEMIRAVAAGPNLDGSGARRHSCAITAERLTADAVRHHDQITPNEHRMIRAVTTALTDIAEDRRA